MQTYKVIERITEALWDKCKAEGDKDILKAEECGFKESIIDLFSSCYDADSFLEWLDKHHLNPADGFQYAEIYSRDELEEDEWLDYCEDCLMCNDEYVCVRW